MTCKRVQVHASHLPWSSTRNCSPLRCTQLQSSQHLEWNVRNVTRFTLLVRFETARHIRQLIERVIAADEVTEQCFTSSVLRLRVDHLHDISQRRILAHVRLEE